MFHVGIYFSVALSLVYFITPNWFVKALPIWTAALAAVEESPHPFAVSVAIGLFASSFGDIFLELDDDYGIDMFIPGLLCFLVAHLFYIRSFAGKMISTTWKTGFPLVVIYYIWIMSTLIPKVETALKAPVAVYGIAITTMALFSINRFLSTEATSTSRLLSLLGSLSFVASDSVLAFNKFHTPIKNAKTIVMITYYLGQILIASSTQFLTESNTKKK